MTIIFMKYVLAAIYHKYFIKFLDYMIMAMEMERFENKRLLTVKELAEMLGLKPQTIYNRMNQGLLPIKRKKIGRLVRFEKRDVDKFIKSLPSRR